MPDYKIMHKGMVIAQTSGFQITDIVHSKLCPVMLKIGSDIRPWVSSRSIDIHRANARRLFSALGLGVYVTTEDIINAGHAVTIGDNWWVQKKDEDLNYDQLKSYDDRMADIALNGRYSSGISTYGYTELGTLGSFEKAWRKENGVWYLYKKGSKEELLSEYYACSFLKSLSLDVAEYNVVRHTAETGIEREYITSRDYTEGGKYDFESFEAYFGDNDDCLYLSGKLNEMSVVSKEMIKDYATMCLFDSLLCNTDRHNGNVGFLRDSESGKIVRLAPMYDYNISLASACELNFCKQPGFMDHFITNYSEVLGVKNIMLEKSSIAGAVRKATNDVILAFPDLNKACMMCGKYILDAYEHIEMKLQKHIAEEEDRDERDKERA